MSTTILKSDPNLVESIRTIIDGLKFGRDDDALNAAMDLLKYTVDRYWGVLEIHADDTTGVTRILAICGYDPVTIPSGASFPFKLSEA